MDGFRAKKSGPLFLIGAFISDHRQQFILCTFVSSACCQWSAFHANLAISLSVRRVLGRFCRFMGTRMPGPAGLVTWVFPGSARAALRPVLARSAPDRLLHKEPGRKA